MRTPAETFSGRRVGKALTRSPLLHQLMRRSRQRIRSEPSLLKRRRKTRRQQRRMQKEPRKKSSPWAKAR